MFKSSAYALCVSIGLGVLSFFFACMFCILLGTRLPFPKPNVTWVVESDDATLCCAGRLDWSSGPIHSAAWPVGKREFCLQGFHSHLALQVTYMYHVLSYFITFYHRHPSFTHNLPMETTPERNTAWATLCGTAHLISIPAVVNLNENPKNNKKHYFWKKAAMTVGKVIFWCHGLPIWCPWWSPLVSFSCQRELVICRSIGQCTTSWSVWRRSQSTPQETCGFTGLGCQMHLRDSRRRNPQGAMPFQFGACLMRSAEVYCKIALSWKLRCFVRYLCFKGWKSEDSHFDSFFGLKAGGFRPCHQFKRFWHGGNMEWRNEVYPRPFLRTLIIPIFVMLIILSVEKWLVKE